VSAAAPTARDVRKLIRGASAGLTGRERGPDQRVRRESYDVEDRRAKVFSPIGDGSIATGRGYIDDLVQLAEEYDLTHRKPGERAPLGAQAVRVLKVMLQKGLRFDTGQLDPAVRTIASWTGYTYKTVHAALTRLRAHHFLDWVRRSIRVVDPEGGADRREQTTNAYSFGSFAEWPKGVLQRWRDLRERRRRRLAARAALIAGDAPSAPAGRRRPSDPALAAALDALEAGLQGPNPTMGECTRSGVQEMRNGLASEAMR
jgi:hypothetical protein